MSNWPTLSRLTIPTCPPRKVFFSFHYQPDVTRAQVVRNSWVTKEDRQEAGFFDSSVFESKKRISRDALKDFLRDGLVGTTVTCVLIGTETAFRPWVRYEIVRSFQRGNGIFGIRIHGIRNFRGEVALAGQNPFDHLVYEVVGDRIHWQESSNGRWVDYTEVPSVSAKEVPYAVNTYLPQRFASLFPVYDWIQNDGYRNLGTWVHDAAQKAGKT